MSIKCPICNEQYNDDQKELILKELQPEIEAKASKSIDQFLEFRRELFQQYCKRR